MWSLFDDNFYGFKANTAFFIIAITDAKKRIPILFNQTFGSFLAWF